MATEHAPRYRVNIHMPAGVIVAASRTKPVLRHDSVGRLVGVSIEPPDEAAGEVPAYIRWQDCSAVTWKLENPPKPPAKRGAAAGFALTAGEEARILRAIGEGLPNGARYSKRAARDLIRMHRPEASDLMAMTLIENWLRRSILEGGKHGKGLQLAKAKTQQAATPPEHAPA